jgi:predicted DNA-binding transcriptional regulator YafY
MEDRRWEMGDAGQKSEVRSQKSGKTCSLKAAARSFRFSRMHPLRTLEQVEADVCKLSPQEQAQLRGWLEDLIEDRLELTDSFKQEIEAGKRDIAEGRVRIRRP